MIHRKRTSELLNALHHRILVIDGAMGTAIQEKSLTPQDFGGPDFQGCNEYLVLSRPDLIQGIHESYLEVGCDIIETNSFCGTPVDLDRYGLGKSAYELGFHSARIARQAAEKYSTPSRRRFVAGALGPTHLAISVTGGITFESLLENYYVQAKGLFEGGADYLLLETCHDTRNIKAGLLAFERLFAEAGARIPIAISVTLEPTGALLAGQSIEALYASVSHLDLLYLGINCATGPEFMTDPVRTLAKHSLFRIACVPNAGLPDENGCYLETPDMFSNTLGRFVQEGWINLLGGCCGTHPDHTRALVELAAKGKPRNSFPSRRSFLSGVDYLEINEENSPIIVGDDTNILKNEKFKSLVCEGKYEESAEIARGQIKNGAQILDICLALPDREEGRDMEKFLDRMVKKVRTPLMISSSDPRVIERALTFCQGKSLIQADPQRLESIAFLAKKYGAALVVGLPDSPFPIYTLLTQKFGIPPEDIYWKIPLAGSAIQALEVLRRVKRQFPGTKTIANISSISEGLPVEGQKVLNSVVLHHCAQSGLNLAVASPEKLVPYSSLSEEERLLAENLLHDSGKSLAQFLSYFSNRGMVQKKKTESLSVSERLSRHIIEGSKADLIEDLNEALKSMRPLEIIQGPLMQGMDEVGRLFTANKTIIAEILQSAEVMKSAIAFLEPFMEKSESAVRGKILLATVKGDVHDIGKNLVEVILANNGFTVVDLGIRVPPEQLIDAVREHQPDIVGLSGLLVKSAQQMLVTAADLAKAGISTPVLLGGAALSSQFVDKQIAKAYPTGTVAYAQDAISGLNLAKIIVDPEKFEKFKEELQLKRSKLQAPLEKSPAQVISSQSPTQRSQQIAILPEVPRPPDFDRHILRNTPIEHIWKLINPLMLYGRHLGIRGGSVKLLEKGAHDPLSRKEIADKDPKAIKIWDTVQEVKEEYRGTEIMKPAAIFRFFRATADGNQLLIQTDSPVSPVCRIEFQRQRKPDGLCLADYVRPVEDTIAFFIVTVGKGVRQLAEMLKNQGNYLKSHIIQALALESAEAYAEMIHAQIRKAWGFPDPPEMSLIDRFQAKYRGKRYSFGYPACPRLDDQALIWQLLNPAEIGISLTDGFMMDPEASVSALVFHHPQASYFSVGHQIGESGYDDNR